MKPQFNFTSEEKLKIKTWKDSLPNRKNRTYSYLFVENGNYSQDDYKLYDFTIKSNDNFYLTV